jgi:hypothetical protein
MNFKDFIQHFVCFKLSFYSDYNMRDIAQYVNLY